jgi:acyl dehydratase
MTNTTTQTLKSPSFQAIEVGEELGPMEVIVDDHYVKQFAFSVDDYTPIHDNKAVAAHAAILAPDLLRLFNTRYDPNSELGLHQREELWIHSPVQVGERVKMAGKFVEKYVKRNKGYVVMEASAHSAEDGRLLITSRATEVARADPGINLGSGSAPSSRRQVKGEMPRGVPPAKQARADLAPGTPVLGPVKVVHQDQMSVFSNIKAFWRQIHTDPDVARELGSDRTIAQGLMEAMYVSEMATAFFGDAWLRSGWMSLAFLHPVFAEDELSTKGVVTAPETREDPSRLEVEVWVENQHGVKVAVGWMGACLS